MGLFDKFRKKPDKGIPSESDDGKGFKYLDRLIHSKSKEIKLDFDIELESKLGNNEEKTYREGIALDIDNLVIDGNGHTIDAKGKAKIFRCTAKNVTIKNMTIKNGYGGAGGAIRINDGGLKISNIRFFDNRSEERGGAIACFYGEMEIEACTFSANSASNDGGGAICIYGGILDMSKSDFIGNSAKIGGAMDISNADFTIDGCTFSGNSAVEAGAIDNSGPNPLAPTPIFYESYCEIKDSVFERNSADESGAISSSKMLNITDSKILSNTSSQEYLLYFRDNVKLINCEISGNTSDEGIIGNDDSLEIYGCKFSDNRSYRYLIYNDSSLGIFNTDFIENNADDAVVYNNGEHCIVEGGTFEGNLSNGDGTNIYNRSELTLKNPKIDGDRTIINESWGNILIKNSPPDFVEKIDGYGDVVVEDASIPKVKTFDFGYLDRIIRKSEGKEILLEEDILFENYEKDYYEGGIELDIDGLVIDGAGKTIDGNGKTRIFTVTGKDITLKNITFKNGKSHKNYDNMLNNNGGALRVVKGAELTVKNCRFLNNSSQEFGGAISNGGELKLYKSKVSRNESESHGGAIYNYHGNLDLSKSVLGNNDANQMGGAIYNVCARLNIEGSVLSDNSVTGSGGGGIGSFGLGGAVYSTQGNMDISKSVFLNNYGASGGGAIYNSEGDMTIAESAISKNRTGGTGFGGAVYSSEKGINKIFNFITQEINPRSVSSTQYFNADEIAGHTLKGMDVKDCTFADNEPYDLAVEAIDHGYLKEFSSQLGYSVYDYVIFNRKVNL